MNSRKLRRRMEKLGKLAPNPRSNPRGQMASTPSGRHPTKKITPGRLSVRKES